VALLLESRRQFPVVTAACTGAAAVSAVLQYTVPAMIPALERAPGQALLPGQWWRLVTPLLVQTLGWYQVIVNLVSLALIGVIAEFLLGRMRWAILFAAGTLGGQTDAYLSGEPGGGDSIAICGLAGGVAVALLIRPSSQSRFAAYVVTYYIAALAGWGFGGPMFAGLACLLVGVLRLALNRADGIRAQRALLTGAATSVAVMAVTGDIHGLSLGSGMLTMLVLPAAPRTSASAAQSPKTTGHLRSPSDRPNRDGSTC
jgi:hypothetical protein